MSKVSQDRLQKVVELYQSGFSFVEIERELRIGQNLIQQALKNTGIVSRRATRRPMPESRKRAIASYYAQGHSIGECIDRYHATSSTVTDCLKEFGIQIRFGKWSQNKIQDLVEFYEAGNGVAKCTRKFGTNGSTIRKYLRQMGVSLRPQQFLRGSEHPLWKGDDHRFYLGTDGYIYVRAPKGHPKYPRNILESHFVMEQMIGRYLLSGEVVHHKDKNKQNNSPENLQLFSSNGEHLKFELVGQVPKWTEEGKRRMWEGHQRWREQRRNQNRSKSDGQP